MPFSNCERGMLFSRIDPLSPQRLRASILRMGVQSNDGHLIDLAPQNLKTCLPSSQCWCTNYRLLACPEPLECNVHATRDIKLWSQFRSPSKAHKMSEAQQVLARGLRFQACICRSRAASTGKSSHWAPYKVTRIRPQSNSSTRFKVYKDKAFSQELRLLACS